jgi:hypothetical protein
MNEFSYHILPIIHAYNTCISWLWSYARLRSKDTAPVVCSTPVRRRVSSRMPDSSRKKWLWSYILTPVALPDFGRRHDSDCRSCRMSYLLICERLRMVELDDCNIVSVFCTDKVQGGQDRAFQFWGGLANNEAHNDLPWFWPLLGGNSPTSSGLILKINMCYKGWAECSRSSCGKGKKWTSYTLPEG